MTQAFSVTRIPFCLLGFRGCVKEVAFARGVVVNLASVSSRAVRVNQDGCLSSDSTVNCGGNDSILVYRGSQQSVYESGLQPFTGNVAVSKLNATGLPSAFFSLAESPLQVWRKPALNFLLLIFL